MKKLIATILLTTVLLSGCGGHYINCVTALSGGGMNVCLDYVPVVEVDPEQLEDIVQVTEEITRLYYPWVGGLREVLKQRETLVQVTKADLKDNCRDIGDDTQVCDDIGGFNSKGQFIMIEAIRPDSCLIQSALMHEILHTVDQAYLPGGQARVDAKDWKSHHSAAMMFNINYELGDPLRDLTIERLAYVKLEDMGWRKYNHNCFR